MKNLNNLLKKKRTRLLAFYFLIFSLATFLYSNHLKVISIDISGQELEVFVADSDAERERGLSDRKSLNPDRGMLFVFEKSGIYSFWMKDTHFPLDIIWIDENLMVREITKNISSDTYPQGFKSSMPIQYVVEVNAGWVEKNNIQVGNALIYK